MHNEKMKQYIPDDQTLICRYMDLPRFMSLLQNKSLYFTRADSFEDPLEGDIPEIYLSKMIDLEKRFVIFFKNPNFNEEVFKQEIKNKFAEIKKQTFINCWTEFDFESYALWKIYSQKYGVAIQTTVGKLQEMTKNKGVIIYKVKYLDDSMDDAFIVPRFKYEKNLTFYSENFFVCKNIQYSYEKEIRAILYGCSGDNQEINVCLSDLLENIYVSPFAEEWFVKLIEDIVNKYGLNKVRVKSSKVAVKKWL